MTNTYGISVNYHEIGFARQFTDGVFVSIDAGSFEEAAQMGAIEFIEKYNLGLREPLSVKVEYGGAERYFSVKRRQFFTVEEFHTAELSNGFN